MPYVGYSGVANSALTHPGNAEGVCAQTYFGVSSGDIGEGVAGDTVIWRGTPFIVEEGFILMQTSDVSDPQDYILEENYHKIRLENY
jgi:hypothetical protein